MLNDKSDLEVKKASKRMTDLFRDCKNLHIIQVPQMSDEEYDEIKEVFEFCGYKWSEKLKGFLNTEDNRQELYDIFFGGANYIIDNTRKWKEKTQFYPTPNSIAERCAELCEFVSGDIVLEPSAGRGNLVKVIPDDCTCISVEPDDSNYTELKSLKRNQDLYKLTFEDFYSEFNTLRVDKVIMNPPFSGCRDAIHVKMAYSLLNKGGVLVAVVNENMLYYDNPISKDFRIFLKAVKAEMYDVPIGSFKESGTMVNTVIIRIRKQ